MLEYIVYLIYFNLIHFPLVYKKLFSRLSFFSIIGLHAGSVITYFQKFLYRTVIYLVLT